MLEHFLSGWLFFFWTTPNRAQGLFMALYSEIIFCKAQGIIWDMRIEPRFAACDASAEDFRGHRLPNYLVQYCGWLVKED